MSKKDYQAIARAFHEACEAFDADGGGSTSQLADDIKTRLASTLAADNPRFDRARFIEACETGKCKGMRG